MDYSKPTLLVISGPNGAGKSTFIASQLPDAFEGIISFDRDKTRTIFEQDLRPENLSSNELAAKATRMMWPKTKSKISLLIIGNLVLIFLYLMSKS